MGECVAKGELVDKEIRGAGGSFLGLDELDDHFVARFEDLDVGGVWSLGWSIWRGVKRKRIREKRSEMDQMSSPSLSLGMDCRFPSSDLFS